MFVEKKDFVLVGVLGEAHNVQGCHMKEGLVIYIIPSNGTGISGHR